MHTRRDAPWHVSTSFFETRHDTSLQKKPLTMTETINLDDELFESGEITNFDLEQIVPKAELKFEVLSRRALDNELLFDYNESGIDLVNHDLKSISKIFEN